MGILDSLTGGGNGGGLLGGKGMMAMFGALVLGIVGYFVGGGSMIGAVMGALLGGIGGNFLGGKLSNDGHGILPNIPASRPSPFPSGPQQQIQQQQSPMYQQPGQGMYQPVETPVVVIEGGGHHIGGGHGGRR